MNTEEFAYTKSLENEVGTLRTLVSELQEQLSWFKKQIFGRRSEKLSSLSHPDQLLLDGFDGTSEKLSDKKTQEVPAHKRKKPERHGNDSLAVPEGLPTEEIIIDIPEDQKHNCNRI